MNYYSFKVPKDVRIVNEDSNPVELVKSNQINDQISVVQIFIFEVGRYPNSLPENLEEWIRQDLMGNTDIILDQTTLDNQPAVIASYSGGGMTGPAQHESVYVIHPQGEFIISISYANNGDDGEIYSSYQEILNTFEFSYPTKNNSNLVSFQSQNIDLSFTYPKSYGQAVEEISTIESSGGRITSGQSITITFENNKNVNLILTTNDYQAFKELYFTGVNSIRDICPEETVDQQGNGCQVVSLDEKEWLERTHYLVDEGIYNVIHSYSFPLTELEKYSGLMVVQSFDEVYKTLNSEITEEERVMFLEQFSRKILNQDSPEDINIEMKEVSSILDSISI